MYSTYEPADNYFSLRHPQFTFEKIVRNSTSRCCSLSILNLYRYARLTVYMHIQHIVLLVYMIVHVRQCHSILIRLTCNGVPCAESEGLFELTAVTRMAVLPLYQQRHMYMHTYHHTVHIYIYKSCITCTTAAPSASRATFPLENFISLQINMVH